MQGGFTGRNPDRAGQVDLAVKNMLIQAIRHGQTARLGCGANPTFAITHDFLATMLGTDRPTVSLAAGLLQKKGVIKWTRSAVQILSRAKLEKCACECYAAMREDRYGDGPLRQGDAFKPDA